MHNWCIVLQGMLPAEVSYKPTADGGIDVTAKPLLEWMPFKAFKPIGILACNKCGTEWSPDKDQELCQQRR